MRVDGSGSRGLEAVEGVQSDLTLERRTPQTLSLNTSCLGIVAVVAPSPPPVADGIEIA